jgi:thiol:disulfide interchange protein
MLRKFLPAALALFFAASAFAQNPVKWSFSTKDAGNGQADLVFTGTIDEGWYTYSQFLESEDGPVATTLNFKEGPHFKLLGKATEGGEKITVMDPVFGMKLTKFKHKAVITQRVQVSDASQPIVGYLNFMTCNDEMCLPPKDVDFSFKVTPAGNGSAPTAPDSKTGDGQGAVNPTGTAPADAIATENTDNPSVNTAENPVPSAPADENFKGFFDTKRDINAAKFVNNCSTEVEENSSLWWVFVAGFLGGLLALLTPCVFPMIPLTVTFFTKRSKDRATGLRNALWYGASIVTIYVAIGIILTMIFGPTILNEMSTDMYFNLLFFVVFVAFALSFFGFFEITLPSSWVNRSDQMADRGGMLGIFFMAFTLALVSFSCTGPIVGTLLVETAKSNAGAQVLGLVPARPLVGMTGFGLALALPFALFAMFPGWLQSLPKSGGWMDNVKITLGFVELALALKFLSTADMVRHWNFLKFELFLGLWLLIALLLGLYQLGILKLKGAEGRPGLGRLSMAALSLAFAAYLGYGLFNYRSLSLLSGIAPPVHYNFFRPMDCPHGLDCYHDFDEALAIAKLENKPIFVDFTGYGCVNCRKMEENVWKEPAILSHLKDKYVLVSLYVDDQERLFPEDKFHYLLDPHTGEKIRTKGDKWAKFEINNFGQASQPWYVLMHHDGKTLLNQPRGYTPDSDTYKAFLDCGYDAFQRLQSGGGSQEMLGAR